MKTLLAIIVSLVSAGLCPSQEPNKATVILSAEDVIRRMIASGAYEGHDSKIIGGLGDAAAVTITKVLAEQKPKPGQIDSILLILTQAFANSSMMPMSSDQEPRTAFFVLQFLDFCTSDPQLRSRISETKRYIREQFAKSKQPRK
jgi:hypothetical protein